jgi:cytochrome c6
VKLHTIIATAFICIGSCSSAVFGQSDTAALYKSKCEMCHGAEGKADTRAGKMTGAQDFHSPEVAKMTDTQLIAVVTDGKGKMPGFQGKLTPEQIASLVKYVRSFK